MPWITYSIVLYCIRDIQYIQYLSFPLSLMSIKNDLDKVTESLQEHPPSGYLDTL